MHPSTPTDPPLQTVDLPTGKAAFTDTGEGPAIVMVHGYPGTHRDFRWLEPALEGALRCVRLDLPGFGGTPRGRRHRPADMAAHVVAVMDALGIEEAVILGHSAGGIHCAELAARHPERVSHLVLLSSPGLRPHQGWLRSRPALAAGLLKAPLIGLVMRPVVPLAFRALGFPPTIPQAEMRHGVLCSGAISFERHAGNLRHVGQPTMLAWTTDDPLVEPAIPEEASAVLPAGPRLRLEGGGHYSQKHHATEIGRALLDWVPS